MRVLVTGTTGFIGSRLLASLLQDDSLQVRALVRSVRDHDRFAQLGCEVAVADVTDPVALSRAMEGVDVAYYLVHALATSSRDTLKEQERVAAEVFAQAAQSYGVQRVIYLGGLGESPNSPHLISRQLTAETLAEHGPPLTYFRAGMVVGSGSASFNTLHSLVKRLPVMLTPAWLRNQTQPIHVTDVVAYLAESLTNPSSISQEVQIGGPERLSYGQMLDAMAEALGRRPSLKIPVPLLTPWLSSHWIGLMTPVDSGVAKALVESLSNETVVTDSSAAESFTVEPIGFREALRLEV